ncbi:S8 family peptidase [[Clostridium] fimetarium]|uniref:Subtilase family protein n=1 Tax=[Clostridium] fimetarium TaxID=99656 RepID=A0A1I0RJV1_9FIRM|nr:S8 family peptidase [[Clostridium] fimetarium]SEW41322.1 Subtilase family protein [[Clostridium] fimetarium]
MNDDDRKRIISNDYADLIVEYSKNLLELFDLQNETINYIDSKYAVVYIPENKVTQQFIHEKDYSVIPKLLGLLDTTNLEAMGVKKIQNVSSLALKGQGVLLGFVDTGIEYTNPIFKNTDNSTRILSIWDQSIENKQASADIFYYGTEYNEDNINLALKNDVPLSIVPSTDEIGHGTMLAGLAGGSNIVESDFVGVVPLSEYVVVKLKPAKSNIKLLTMVPENTICYQENDIMFGIQYLTNVARRLGRPIAICIGLGTNQGSHDGSSPISDMILTHANRTGIAIIVAAGNEGNAGHHYYGTVDPKLGFDKVEIEVAEGESGFAMELWGSLPGTYSIDITSPNGEYIPRILPKLQARRKINFIFQNTIILVDYFIVETQTGDQLILIRFMNPSPGTWIINVYAGKISSGFHIWLPMRGFILENTFFKKPNPYTTVTTPGNALIIITATAYNHRDQSIYLNASKGFTRTDFVKPDLAAPGVNVYSPLLANEFGDKSGTSIAAALTTGIAAMLLEWGIVKDNYPSMDCLQIKKFLFRGVNRNENIIYPNREWGYGTIDINGTYESLQVQS